MVTLWKMIHILKKWVTLWKLFFCVKKNGNVCHILKMSHSVKTKSIFKTQISKNGSCCEKMSHTLKKWVHGAKWVTIYKMRHTVKKGHTMKSGLNCKKWVTFWKVGHKMKKKGHTVGDGSHSKKWLILWKMIPTVKNVSHSEK